MNRSHHVHIDPEALLLSDELEDDEDLLEDDESVFDDDDDDDDDDFDVDEESAALLRMADRSGKELRFFRRRCLVPAMC